jgi:translation elongation factor EF-Ts
MATDEIVGKIMESNEDEIAAKIAVKEDALIGELDEDIARAATSWSPAFPGKKEVSREVAKSARAIMQMARTQNVRPSSIRAETLGIVANYENFFVAIDGLRLGA